MGIIRDCFLIVTGSSSIELKRGGERLPGRRGIFLQESELRMFSLKFKEYIKNLESEIKIPDIEFTPSSIYKASEKLSYYSKELKSLFNKFLITGGFPLSINEFLSNGEISRAPYVTHLQALIGDLMKAGKREMYLFKRNYLHNNSKEA